MPQHKGTAEAPPVKSPLTPRGKFEEHVVDVPELKKETARKAARRFSEAKEGDAYLLHTPAAPFVLAKKGLAARLDRPAVLDWLAQPSPGDLKALQDLPEEARELAQQRINEFLQKQPAPLRLDPRLKLFLRAGTIASEKYGSQPTGESTAAAAERQAREAAQRLSSTP